MMQGRTAGRLDVRVGRDRAEAGAAAAERAANALRELLRAKPEVRVVFAAAPSQSEMLAGLRAADRIDWSRVTAFHMDEYVDLPAWAPQRFDAFLRRELWDQVRPGRTHPIDPGTDPEASARDYAGLLGTAPIDLVCLGIGNNGHLAFNDPPVADFEDPHAVKVVELDRECREQQVTDECFGTLDEVPTHAVTLTIPTLMSAGRLIATVPGPAKRNALTAALNGPIDERCPASILRTHPDAVLFADADAYGPFE